VYKRLGWGIYKLNPLKTARFAETLDPKSLVASRFAVEPSENGSVRRDHAQHAPPSSGVPKLNPLKTARSAETYRPYKGV
jgi:hypothetical protein